MVEGRARVLRQAGVDLRGLEDRRGRGDDPAEALRRRQRGERAAAGLAADDRADRLQASAPVVEVDPALAAAEPDPEIQELLEASPGPNLGMDFLPGALPFTAGSPIDPARAADIIWFDTLITNVDRTHRNPNLLVWHKQTWLIDHGAAFFRQHGPRPLSHSAHEPMPPPMLAEHVLLGVAGSIEEADERLASRALAAVGEAVARIPPQWLGANPATRRGDFAAFLNERLARPRSFLKEIERAGR